MLRNNWPRFEMVTFSELPNVSSSLVAALTNPGVPKALIGAAYQAAHALTLVESPHYGQFVCFGVSGGSCPICLDPKTGKVVEIVTTSNGPVRLVNTTLQQFISTVRDVLARFPFDSGDSRTALDEDGYLDELDNEWNRAAGELEETLRAIDPAAVVDPNGFWMTFLDDIRIGDFSTAIVIGTKHE